MGQRLVVIFILALIEGPSIALESERTAQIEQAIDKMLERGKISTDDMHRRIGHVMAYGDEALPLVIDRYKETSDDASWPLVLYLCMVGTDRSLDFVREILNTHDKRSATSCAIRNYPINREQDILQLLIELVHVQMRRLDAVERLEQMIIRQPTRAGQLVAALKDEEDQEEYAYQIREILATVSGYRNSLGVSVTPVENQTAYQNNFWREWWKRNKQNDVFTWLVEAASTGREAQAFQRMIHLGDRRAIPFLVSGLDSPSEGVQYWAVVGLKKFDGTAPESGYTWESFQQEKESVISALTEKYLDSVPPQQLSK